MKTPSQLSEEQREVSNGRLLLAVVVFTLMAISGMALARGDVLRLTFPTTLSAGQQSMCRRVEGLMNKAVTSRGLEGPLNVMQLTVSTPAIDGRWNIFAQSFGGTWRQNDAGKFVFDGAGRIELDSADLPYWTDATFSEVLFHEICHFFGFMGPIWQANGCMDEPGYYTGPALAFYQGERDPFAPWMPVAESHFAQSLSPWIMTPALTGSYVPRTLWAVLRDNGNTLSAWGESTQGGNLADILPRRGITQPPVIQ